MSGRRLALTCTGRWRDHPQVINGILWKLRKGAPWSGPPEPFGPWKTCHERLRRWTADGTWAPILAAAQAYDDGTPGQWTISTEPSIRRAHQHSAGARKRGAPQQVRPPGAQDGEAIRRSEAG